MKWPVTLIAALGLGSMAHAESDRALTLARLFTLPPQEAARLVFGPTPEVFVERSPWNSLQPNFVLGTVNKFQMQFFTEPERISPAVCAVTMGYAMFDTSPPQGMSADEGAAWDKLGYSGRPLKLLSWNRQRQYFAAGPARAAPVEPGGKPVTPGKAALAADSCENPVVLRGRFQAPSPEAAILVVTKAEAAVAAAKSRKRLPFKLSERCDRRYLHCRAPRMALASLQVDQIRDFYEEENCPGWDVADLPSGPRRCLSFAADDPDLGQGRYWRFSLVLDGAEKLRRVSLSAAVDPIP